MLKNQSCPELLQFMPSKTDFTSTDSQGTAQPIEASQPSPATAITVETPWNSNLYQVSNNQLNLNSTSKVLRSSSIFQLPNPTEYFSTLKRGLNLARNHLPKSAQHPKNALPDFSKNLRTPAASRSIPQVVLKSLMGNNRKKKPQGVQRHPNRRKQSCRQQREQYVADEEMSTDQTVQLLITDSSTVRSSRQQSQRNTTSANQNDIAPDTSTNLIKELRYNRSIQSQNDVTQPTSSYVMN
ncbi:hypothetical protein F511_20992 [Dorcoceras hygrometricum]|uniref:Uncharacterized protein n=1 Tax=Dorcoceras hygrometricum TaxID=472368 RepID=A0A2Z7CVS3_9LAMI|nr:hypothetical protein F511_20992 [Dorcoceras hygrometricum]